jgi:hypothetical protein
MPLTKSTPTDVIINDFEKSDNPKFDGKSKEKRKEMAIATSYSLKKESVEVLTHAIMSEDKEAIQEAFKKAISEKITAKLNDIKSELFEADEVKAKTRAELNAAKDALEDKRQAKKDDPYAEVKEPKSK